MKKNNMKYRYSIFMLLFALILINYIDRGALPFAINDIAKEYTLSKVQIGAVLGYFGFGYLIGALLGGGLADRFGTKKVWLCFGLAWSVIEIFTAWAGNIGVFFFGSSLMGFAMFRILFGIAEGPAYPLLNKSIANWAPKNERSFSLSLGLLSTQVAGLLTAPIAVFLLMTTHSWRTMFVLLGMVSFMFMVIFYFVFEDSPEKHLNVTENELAEIEKDREEQTEKLPWWTFFQNRTLVLNACGYFAFLYVTFTIMSWGPKYLQDTFHYNLNALWYMAMIPWIGSTVTVVLGGYISDYLYKKYNLKVARNTFAVVMLALTAFCFAMVPLMHTASTIIIFIALGNACNAMINNVYYSVVMDVSPHQNIGVFSGVTLAIANGSAILSPLLSGWLAQYYSYHAIFYATACVAAVSMCCMVMLQPHKKIQVDLPQKHTIPATH
ncbi:MFS transporter [Acinetobacter nectaris]|uniref:MFS transporter n=1 Tax=Acinetobacter nectaris TaxID=1219382 RepID=UPI001F02EC1C|nr:MFS transporter [Acinetobacter nectaris]MCF9045234.1 MFS transporter [Acinetobacter nectaris]